MSQPDLSLRTMDRDHRIDVIRGLALVSIFINHIPGNALGALTSRNFGFSDAAEAFVLLAGVSAALAYGKDFHAAPTPHAISRPWRRAWTLYLVHLMLSLVVLGLVAAVARFGGNPAMLRQDNIQALMQDPTGVFIGLPLMLHQFGYVNILPLYVLLLLAAPLALFAGQNRPGWLLGGSIAIWAVAGLTYTNFKTFPGGNGWFLNPLSWQLLFVIGIVIGLRMKAGLSLRLPPRLVIAAAAWLVISALWVRVPALGGLGHAAMGQLYDLGLPPLLVGFDKGYVQVPRLLHLLALVVVIAALPALKSEAAAPRWAWARLLGRQGLAVFAAGTVLAFAARALRLLMADAGHPPGLLADLAMVAVGVGLMLALAAAREYLKRPPAPPRRRTTPAPAPVPVIKAQPA